MCDLSTAEILFVLIFSIEYSEIIFSFNKLTQRLDIMIYTVFPSHYTVNTGNV